MSKIKAAIDIGSNTILLLIAELKNGKLNTMYEEQRIPRLGKGVDSSGNLHRESMQKAIEAMIHYGNIIDNHDEKVSGVIVTATSAVRDANNRKQFLEKIKDQTGFQVQLLSGDEEAEYTFAGALSTLEIGKTNSLILDIGGGSTELCNGNKQKIIDRHSFQMGSVRFTEKYLNSGFPADKEIKNCRDAVQSLLKDRSLRIDEGAKLIGVAGTMTSLAHIMNGSKEYDSASINGVDLSVNTISKIVELFKEKGSNYFLEKYPVVMRGRSDVFLGGLLILEEVMNYYGFKQITISAGGIRHGAIIKNFLEIKKPRHI